MIRTISTIISILFFHFSALAQESSSIKAGAILPLTGAIASIGEAMRQGIDLGASDAVNIKFNVSYEDDRTANRVEAVNAAKKLVSVNKVDVIFNAYASTVSAISPVLKNAGIPCVVIWDSNRALPTFGKHVVGFGYSNELAGEDMAEFAFNELKRKSAAVIAFHDEWSEVIAKAFADRYKALGGKLTMYENVNGDTTDFKTLLTRVKAQNAEAIYLPLYGSGLHSAIKQARDLKYAGDLLTADSFGDYDIKETGQAAEGLYVTQIWFENEDFKKKYEMKFTSANSTGVNLGYVALSYDAVKLIDALSGKILQAGEKISARSLTDSFAGFKFSGVLGDTHISSNGMTDRREKVLQVKDGKFAVAWAHK